jgi:hypothetical protein
MQRARELEHTGVANAETKARLARGSMKSWQLRSSWVYP